MGGGGDSPPSAPTPTSYGGQPNYIPTDQSGMDTTYQNLMATYAAGASTMAGYLPQVGGAVSSITANPYAAALGTGANQAAGIATNQVIPQDTGASAALYGTGQMANSYADQLLKSAYGNPSGNPQINAVYNQAYSQMMDQTNAVNAMNGVAGSPFGAGVADQNINQFNTNWTANALSSASALNGIANQDFTGANTMGASAVSGAYAAPQLQYAAYNQPFSTDISALGSLGTTDTSLMSGLTTGMNLAGAYLGQGTSASSAYESALMSAYQQQLGAYSAGQTNWGGIGSLAGAGINAADTISGWF